MPPNERIRPAGGRTDSKQVGETFSHANDPADVPATPTLRHAGGYPITASLACQYCGAIPVRPNRRQRRFLARNGGVDNIAWTTAHMSWCQYGIGGGGGRPGGDRRG